MSERDAQVVRIGVARERAEALEIMRALLEEAADSAITVGLDLRRFVEEAVEAMRVAREESR